MSEDNRYWTKFIQDVSNKLKRSQSRTYYQHTVYEWQSDPIDLKDYPNIKDKQQIMEQLNHNKPDILKGRHIPGGIHANITNNKVIITTGFEYECK